MNTQTTPPVSGKVKPAAGVIGFGAAIAIVLVLTALLHFRVTLSPDALPKKPLAVDSLVFQLQDDYQRTVSYLGLVVAGKKADLGFEIPGLIATAPPRPGTPVQRGDVIVMLDETALLSKRQATAATLQQAQVELELAQLKAQRQQDLIATGAVSKDIYDETRLRALALASHAEAVASNLSSIDIELQKSRLVAPFDGIIADRYLQQGAVVNPGMPVVRLLEITGQEAHIGVSVARVEELEPGGIYTLKLRDQTLEAQLLSIRPDVDPVTRTIAAVFALPQDTNVLDGEPITLELQETVQESGGWLPIAALQEGGRGVWTVLRLEPDGKVLRTVREAVEILEVRGDLAFARGTLPSGSRIVANGVHRISPGTVVSVRGVN